MNPTARSKAAPREMVDVVYGITATVLPADYEWPLYRAVARAAPWIRKARNAGIHPVRATRSADGSLLVAQRAKLVVRMPRDRVCAASVLEGLVLDVGGAQVRVGEGTFRKFAPAQTLYSARVVTGDADEASFVAAIARELAALDIRSPVLCGRPLTVQLEEGPMPAFSVAVHGLGEEASLRLQAAGLGKGREVGCGIFVPHKAIVPAA